MATGFSGKPILRVAALALAGLALLACTPGRDAAPAPPAAVSSPPQVQWAKEAARPLAGVDPGAVDDDLMALGPMVAGASLVGMGEATHGCSEFFRMKHRILRYLVERQGFTAFGLEADLAACRALDTHVLTGAGDPRGLVEQLGMWPWAAEEVVDLVGWMRAWNAEPGRSRKVRFFGFDMQDGASALDQLLDYVAAVDPAGRETMAEWLLPCRAFMGLGNPFRLPLHLAPEGLRRRVRLDLLAAQGWLEDHQAPYAAALGQPAFAWAQRMAELLLQFEEYQRAFAFPGTLMAENLRDRFMADNVDWAVRHLGDGTRAALWAHNGHVNRKGMAAPLWINTGDWLAQRHGSGYLALGFAFGAGSCNAVARGGDRGVVRAFQLPPAGPGSYEQALAMSGLAMAYLDLRGLDLTRPGARWFSEPHLFREVGADLDPAEGPREFPTDLAGRFDVLVFIANVTPSRLFLAGGEPVAASDFLRPDPGAVDQHGVLGDHHDAVLDHVVAGVPLGAAGEGLDHHVVADADVLVQDGAFDVAVAADAQGHGGGLALVVVGAHQDAVLDPGA